MRDIFTREYTELRNAPHFIFNGKHTRDFGVMNVQVDSGLAKDTFLANRNLTIERTRYSDKSYLLGYTEEPLSFKIRLLFEESSFTEQRIQGLKRWLDTPTFKEFKFDNEEESALHIIMYAMVKNTSELTHNVINDGYLDIEFETNSSRKYTEIMEDNYDFSISVVDKLISAYKAQFSNLSTLKKRISKGLKLFVARDNYAGILGFFQDKDFDRIPDGWTLVSGSKNDISIDNEGKLFLKNVKLRRVLNLINNRNYVMKMDALNGKIRIHEDDYNTSDIGIHQFKYRRNLLSDFGTFDSDSNNDGIGNGWNKVAPNPNMVNPSYNKQLLFQPNNAGLGSPSVDGEWIKYSADAGKTISLYSSATFGTTALTTAPLTGQKYTFSFTVKVPANSTFSYHITNSEITSRVVPVSTTEKIYYITMTYTRGTDNQHPIMYVGNQYVWIKDVKLEAGTQATYDGTYSINKSVEQQTVSTFGAITTTATMLKDSYYLLAYQSPNFRSIVSVDGKEYINDRRTFLDYIPFKYTGKNSNIILKSLYENAAVYQYVRLYNITKAEYDALTARKTPNDNLLYTYNILNLSTNAYQTTVKTDETFGLTGKEVYKTTKLTTNTPPVYIQQDRTVVKNNESVTASIWFKHDGNNKSDLTTALNIYNNAENKIEASTAVTTLTKDWQRITVTFTNTSGSEKEINAYFYPSKAIGNITYFTSPQIEYTATMSNYKEPAYEYINRTFPYFDSRPYFEIDYTGQEGYIKDINLWELNDANKAKYDKGTPIENIVGINYSRYTTMVNEYKNEIDVEFAKLDATMKETASKLGLIFTEPNQMIKQLKTKLDALKVALSRPNIMEKFVFSETQKIINQLEDVENHLNNTFRSIAQKINDNQSAIKNSELAKDVIEVYNFGDKPVYPTFEFKSMDGTDIIIENLDTGQRTTITDNIPNEVITLIGASEEINTSRTAPYFKYDYHDDEFIGLQVGHNTLRFSGNCTCKITYQFIKL